MCCAILNARHTAPMVWNAASIFQTFLNLKVWRAVSKSRRKGYAVEEPPEGQDAMQMSGTFIISPEGHVLLPFYYDPYR